MTRLKRLIATITLFIGMGVASTAHAGIPVIDSTSIAQQIQQVVAWGVQFQQMQQQLQRMQQQFDSLNGSRGMANLVNNPAARQYLPADYQTILNSGYGNSAAIRTNARVFDVTDTTLGATTDAARAFQSSGNQAAFNRATAEEGYRQASQRFSTIQVLLDRVNSAPDAKDMADLQGRIQAEQVMMQNESAKLAMLSQMQQAQRDLAYQQAAEIRMKSTKGVMPVGW
ncbi:MAG: P-type DNA transfer protein VirB5 [Rhodoferax sp.]|nr:P-type DNA transfer protein VirB5 [Rhodoferax sp.]